MNIFLKRILFFAVGAILLLELTSYILIKSGLFESYIAGAEIYYSIRKSKQKHSSKTLLLGDSVAKQLFDNEGNEYIESLACNRAISVAGHYFLLKNYLEAGNDIDTVFFLSTPFSFQNNLDEIYTYHYFLKPFGGKKYSPLFTERVKAQLQKIPFQFVLNSQFVLATDWAPIFQSRDKKERSFLSPISLEYLAKIKDLSMQYDFQLVFIPAPIRESRREELQQLINNSVGHSLQAELESFLAENWYLDDTYFMDEEHINKAKIKEVSNKLYYKYIKS